MKRSELIALLVGNVQIIGAQELMHEKPRHMNHRQYYEFMHDNHDNKRNKGDRKRNPRFPRR